jgi:Flp pilus assembly pilin Flp
MIDKLVVKFLVLKMWLRDERGQDLMEYALITGGIGIALLGALAVLTPGIKDWFQSLADAVADSIIK